MANDKAAWEDHDHEALVHSHRHYHVTHNFRETGDFEHLSADHEHAHDHAAVSHGHHPHEDFEGEHAGEAHVHDHSEPVHDVPAPTSAPKPRKVPVRKTAKAPATPKP